MAIYWGQRDTRVMLWWWNGLVQLWHRLRGHERDQRVLAAELVRARARYRPGMERADERTMRQRGLRWLWEEAGNEAMRRRRQQAWREVAQEVRAGRPDA